MYMGGVFREGLPSPPPLQLSSLNRSRVVVDSPAVVTATMSLLLFSNLLSLFRPFCPLLSQLRVAQVTGGAASKLAKISVVRKKIARTLTVYHQSQKKRVSLEPGPGCLPVSSASLVCDECVYAFAHVCKQDAIKT